MKPQGNVEIYRVAFDAANSELAEISAEFERLRIRKEHIEKLVQVLQPLIAEGEETVERTSVAGSAPNTENTAESPIEARGGSEAVPADPFQRRIDHVLGIGGGIRDVRKYSRQF
ncbi:MAG TPA: hypothetical protein VK574_09580 [Terracidiphilus sp.]|jgi:hypothetical protein|nr:hypothetical protein [Terracidiphilus sp.]